MCEMCDAQSRNDTSGMMEQDTAFRLYRRAQKFLALNIDEAIDPNMWGDGELSEAEQLIAELAFTPFTAAKRREALAFLSRIGAVRVGRSNRWTVQRGDRLMSLHIVEG